MSVVSAGPARYNPRCVRPLTLASRSVASLVLAVLTAALFGGAPLRASPAPVASASDADSALPAQLSLAEALRRFRASGLDLLIADAAVAGAQADALAAGAVANPSITVGVGSALGYQSDPAACPQCSPLAVNLGLSDNGLLGDLVSGRRGLRRRIADAALRAARLGRADAERTLISQVKQAYAQTALAQRLVAFADEVQSAANKTLELNQVRYRTGAISEAALARVEVDKLTADQARDGATQSLRLAQVGLAFLLGARRAVPVFTVGDEFSGAGASSVVPERQALIDRALQTRPDLDRKSVV